MSRLIAIDPAEATGMMKELFDTMEERMGRVPNVLSMLANSPAALTAYLGFNAGLHNASISSELCEQIALMVSHENKSNYCSAAHSYMGALIGLDEQTLENARHGLSSDARTHAALHFAKEALNSLGAVPDAAILEVKAAGYTEGEIMEIIAQVSLCIFTNYVNMAASTDIDFPGPGSPALFPLF